ncbi:Uncharacterized protein Fot_27590 [Forsythia ovata]|uniref:Uncharacterized protein n=1 Tax=Forsythia ovata TaxID=205694 RepID=A0ABD1TLK1_9LAMI
MKGESRMLKNTYGERAESGDHNSRRWRSIDANGDQLHELVNHGIPETMMTDEGNNRCDYGRLTSRLVQVGRPDPHPNSTIISNTGANTYSSPKQRQTPFHLLKLEGTKRLSLSSKSHHVLTSHVKEFGRLFICEIETLRKCD